MRIPRFYIAAFFVSIAPVFLAVPAAHAAYTINLQQVGSDVVATGSGSIDTTDLTFLFNTSDTSMINSQEGQVFLGPTSSTNDTFYSGVTGPTSMGTINTNTLANSGSGPFVGIQGVAGAPRVLVPSGYVSGSALTTSTDTWTGQSFSSLGLTPGTYTYTWGSGPDADSLTVNLPEPATFSLLAMASVALLRRRRGAST